uniref:TRYP_2 protein n=1 Tax=Fopius arisanus TaxID=64838 RepID=A0A0C9QQM1_9HYME
MDWKPVKIMKLLLTVVTLFIYSNYGVDSRSPSKIVGGKRVDITEAPFAVTIRHNTTIARCGGVIIGPKWILTAAHCFPLNTTDYQRDPRWFRVVPGVNAYSPDAKFYKIKEVYSHPDFEPDVDILYEIRADIAVIELEEEIPFDDKSSAIELGRDIVPNDTMAMIYGWGLKDRPTKSFTTSLHGLPVKIPSRHQCLHMQYGKPHPYDQMCFYNWNNGTSCGGDSGGPVVAYNKVIGIISIARIDCTTVTPPRATYVYFYKLWIEKIMAGTGTAVKISDGWGNDVKKSSPTPKPTREPRIYDELSYYEK